MRSPLGSGNPYFRAVKRFRWFLLVGLLIAGIAAIAAIYRIDFTSVPPTLENRKQVTYTASARLLVTSLEAPYFRTTVPREVPTEEGAGAGTGLSVPGGAPDIGTLVASANLYPVLIESDLVRQVRREIAGPMEGVVTARAIYSVNSPSRFELSQVPVVEIYAQSSSYPGAVDLAQATVNAFTTYVQRTQDQAGLRPGERIIVEQIQRPAGAVASGGTSLSLPFMLFAIIAAAFLGLAILLDRLFPLGLLPSRSLGTTYAADGDADEVNTSSEAELEVQRPTAQV